MARNLKLFFPDDRTAGRAPKTLIDHVDVTPFWWERHCRDVAREKQITIDLLSADINFTEDHSDPGSPSDGNAWGLVHALMAIARRRNDDGYGNHLPLAWEVRTVSPSAYRSDSDATRTYGLLRSLAAQPRGDESLEECISREFADDHPDDPNPIPVDRGTLSDVFIEDLAHQPSRESSPMDAAVRLLPRWRWLFWRAVDAGDVAVNPDQTFKLRALLKKQRAPMPVDVGDPPAIPILKREGGTYGISLFSIMADLVVDGCLDVEQRMDALTIWEPGGKPTPASVTEWAEWVYGTANGKVTENPAERLKNVALRVTDRMHTAVRGVGNLGGYMENLAGQEHDRGLLFIVLLAHLSLVGKDYSTLKNLAAVYGYKHHDHLFGRPLQNNPGRFARFSQPKNFAKEVVKALKGEPHQLHDAWIWMKRGLLQWYDEKLAPKQGNEPGTIPRETAKRRAPGLFA